MKILFTGFTSRTIGSDRNVYDYISNVFVLQRALELAGHEVDVRPVSLLEDPCIEEDYDCAIVGIAACQGLSSRFKLGALWTLHKFGKRAGIFPSDGKNIYVFPSSVKTCLTGQHWDGATQLDPIDYFLGYLQREKNNTVDWQLGREMKDVWRSVLERMPHSDVHPKCDWPMLVPTHSWGNASLYARHFGAVVMNWDPTNVAIPMQFNPLTLGLDGRLLGTDTVPRQDRERAWVVSSLQDQGQWIKKQKCKWPVITIGNKRKARDGEGVDYIPEMTLIKEIYTKYWGHLAFGYPLADGGWWRMRYIHAAMAGIVTCTDENDARKMPESYQFTRTSLERFSDEKLREVAHNQWLELMDTAWPADRAIATVDTFVRTLHG